MSAPAITARTASSIDEVEAKVWDDLRPDANPFVGHRFLSLMEASRSAAPRTGWQPLHLLLEEDGALKGAVPLYLKGHSWGEYVFDHGWAQAYERAGGRYYPKLQAAVPFTPVPGPRLLGGVDGATTALLAAALKGVTDQLGVSSAHVTFCDAAEAALLEAAGFMRRRGIQYHWHNRGYRDFDDFLDTFRSAKRKMVKKERREAAGLGVRLEVLEGPAATAALDAFYPFYSATVDRRWGSAYLTKAFFKSLGRTMPDEVVMIAAFDGANRMVAGALNLYANDTLYGRLWGSLDEYRYLHFECCYYQAIDLAIRRKIARVEAGAQGQHKLARGYEPVFTHSAHYVQDPALARAVEHFLKAENAAQEDEIAELREMLPFRTEGC